MNTHTDAASNVLTTCVAKAVVGSLVPEDRQEFLSILSELASEYIDGSPTYVPSQTPPLTPEDRASIRGWVEEISEKVRQ